MKKTRKLNFSVRRGGIEQLYERSYKLGKRQYEFYVEPHDEPTNKFICDYFRSSVINLCKGKIDNKGVKHNVWHVDLHLIKDLVKNRVSQQFAYTTFCVDPLKSDELCEFDFHPDIEPSNQPLLERDFSICEIYI